MRTALEPEFTITHFVSNHDDESHKIPNDQNYFMPVELNPLSETFLLLLKFKNVSANWDGHNAKSPDTRTIDNAKRFIEILPYKYQKALYTDELGLTPYGTVTLDWKAMAGNFLSIEIGKSKIGFLSETEDGENPFKESIDFDNQTIPVDVLQVFEKIFV